MSGTVLAAASGVGFGVFQSINVRALRGTDDSYASTFVQVGTAALALAAAALAVGELDGVLDAPLSVPTVLFLAPVVAGRQVERVTLGLWAGAGLVISGALVLVAA